MSQEVKKHYELQITNRDLFYEAGATETLERIDAWKIPYGPLGLAWGKVTVWLINLLFRRFEKAQDKAFLRDPANYKKIHKTPKVHLMAVYESYDKIMKEIV